MSMRENDTASGLARDVLLALSLLTRLPLPRLPEEAFATQARAGWAFPVAGLVVGVLVAGTGAVALAMGLSPVIAAGLCLAAQAIVTGAMHEDGLADTADGFWGGWTVERRLEIMADSRIGTYGVLALILSGLLRWSALSVVLTLSPWLLIAVAVISRAGLPVLMTALPRARPGGLSDQVGRPQGLGVALSVGIGLVLVLMVSAAALAPLMLATLLSLGFCGAIARAKIGGQTGDVLGAAQQMVEIACLLSFAALAP